MTTQHPEELKTEYFNLANFLTSVRIILIPFFIYFLLQAETQKAFYIFLLAGLTDILDGTAARILHQRSKLGTLLDPAADKLLMASAYILLGLPSLNMSNILPLWLIIIVVTRDVMIVITALILHRLKGVKHFRPSLLGKATTVSQVVVIILVLFCNILQSTPSFLNWLYLLTFGLTFCSGIGYALRWKHLLFSK
ncbi:MAG TPA: CDP-alcohol phosphatidyltransferase family protein [Candidatus Aminicenantes bacterium]|nr:CDP-alcohol phosphatidyltransferase family protein [Candidatus Aminicenantes bacterium]